MSPHPFHGVAKDGRPVLDASRGFERLCRALEGKRITVTLSPYRKPRSLPQNSYYWGVVLATFAEHLGYLPDELHRAMAGKFLVKNPGEKIEVTKSTTELSTVEFNEYIEKIMQLAAEDGCVIPDPTDAELISYMEKRNR